MRKVSDAIELPDLVDGDLRLRLPADADVPAITRMCQDADIQRWTRVPSPYTEDDARDFVSTARVALLEGSGVHHVAVAARDGDDVLGCVGLTVDRRDFSGEIGYWVAPGARGRGVATRGSRLLCRLAFDRLGLGYLMLLAAETNPGSSAVAARLGFSHEGTLRSAMLDGPTGDPSAPRCDAYLWGLRPGELT